LHLDGVIRTTCTPDRLLALLHDPVALNAMLPGGMEVRQTGPTDYAFVICKPWGPVSFRMPGTVSLMPSAGGHDRNIVIRAAHLIGGRVNLSLLIRVKVARGMTVLTYEGTMVASGLAGHLLGDNQERVQTGVRSVFLRLKRLAEGGPAPNLAPDTPAGPA
jgi:carbon monoxide dehydrogenase subunit G